MTISNDNPREELEIRVEQLEALADDAEDVKRLSDRLILWLRLHNLVLRVVVPMMRRTAGLFEEAHESLSGGNLLSFSLLFAAAVPADLLTRAVSLLEEVISRRVDANSRDHDRRQLRHDRMRMDYERRFGPLPDEETS